MPVFLLGIGVFAVIAGLAMIGFGVPINEFSFGNTLISAGTTASIGGFIIIAIGMAVGQLRRIAGMLADPAQVAALPRLALPADDLEPAAPRKGAGMAPVPAPPQSFAPSRVAQAPRPNERSNERPNERPNEWPNERPNERPMSDPFDVEPEPAAARADQSFAPSLRNPDEAPMAVDDEISLSPRHPQPTPASAGLPPGALDRNSDSFDWRVPPPPSGAPAVPLRPQQANFDAMWPAEGKLEAKPAKAPLSGPAAGAPKGAPRPAPLAEPKAETVARRAEQPRAVAILKSGVVDGMGYTLYVDGSIEAELPQGTLRFASINELRSHLEKNS